jgi:hypothetical protein
MRAYPTAARTGLEQYIKAKAPVAVVSGNLRLSSTVLAPSIILEANFGCALTRISRVCDGISGLDSHSESAPVNEAVAA